MTDNKIKVLYIAGSGRSGTTLLARLLGELDGFVNVGEAARYLCDGNMQVRQAAKQVPCGCGRPILECPFWSEKVRLMPAELSHEGARMVRTRRFPSLLMASRASRVPMQYRAILSALVGIYREIARETNCRVIVDSSKHPANALLLSLAPEIDLHVLHVVRSPRRVVASWSKKKAYLVAQPARKIIALWWADNLLSEALKIKARSYRRVRYEDFVKDPGKWVQQAATDVVENAPPVSFINNAEATVRRQHTLAGNPDKLEVGKIRIADGNDTLAGAVKWFVNLSTFPLLLRYHYWPGSRGGGSERSSPQLLKTNNSVSRGQPVA